MFRFQGLKNFGGHLRVWWVFPPGRPTDRGSRPYLEGSDWSSSLGGAEPLLAIMLEQLGTSHFFCGFNGGSLKKLFLWTLQRKVCMYVCNGVM